MARTIIIYGHSDDLVEIETDRRAGEPDEIPTGNTVELQLATPSGEGCIVHAAYGHNGCWGIGIAPIDEDKPLDGTNWDFAWALHENGYSAQLTVTAPTATRIKHVYGGDRHDN